MDWPERGLISILIGQDSQLKTICTRKTIKAIESLFNPLHQLTNPQFKQLITLRKGYVPFTLIYNQPALSKQIQLMGFKPIDPLHYHAMTEVLLRCIPNQSRALRVNPTGVRLLRPVTKERPCEVYFENIGEGCLKRQDFQTILASKCSIYKIKYHDQQDSAVLFTNQPQQILSFSRKYVKEGAGEQFQLKVLKTETLERHKQFASKYRGIGKQRSTNIRSMPCLKQKIMKTVCFQGKRSVVQQSKVLSISGGECKYTNLQKSQNGQYVVILQQKDSHGFQVQFDQYDSEGNGSELTEK